MDSQKISEDISILFNLDLEAFFAVRSIINYENPKNTYLLFSDSQVDKWKQKYHFLFETYSAVSELLFGSEYDFLLDIISENLTLECLNAHLFSGKTEERIFRMVHWHFYGVENSDEIKTTLDNDESLDSLYNKVKNHTSSFIGFASFIRQNDRFFKEYFELASEIRTDKIPNITTQFEHELQSFKEKLITKLKSDSPLEISQHLMKKTFNNLGPYSRYYFILSATIGCKSLRLFYDNGTKDNIQILIYNIRFLEQDSAKSLAMLKSLSDETRFKILKFISSEGLVNGKDITRKLNLAPSTISHHMMDLKECGLVTEEPVKNSKYYGISKDSLKEMIVFITKTFKI